MRLIGLFLCSLLVSFISLAESSGHIESYQWRTGERDTIPTWVLNSHGNGRYVGISDPCLDSITGSNQALARAWLLALIDNGIEVQILHENFQNTKVDVVYDLTSVKIKQIMKFSLNEKMGYYKIVRSHITKFGESIVEIQEVDNSESGDYKLEYIPSAHKSINGEYIMLIDEKSIVRGSMHSNININCIINGVRSNISFQENGTVETQRSVSIVDNDTISMKNRGRYWYCDRKIADIETTKYTLNNGLWNAIYKSLLSAIVNDQSYAYTIKQVEQNYESKLLTIIRSSYCDEINVKLNIAQIFNNKLEPVWSVVEMKK